MKLERIEYLVGELPERPQHLTITPDAVRYESHSNLSRPASGIGVFERPLARGDMEAIESGFDPATFESLPDHQGQVLSGDRWKRIRLIAGSGALEKQVGTKLPVDPGLQRMIDWLDRLAEETMRYPRSVLQLTVEGAALDRNGEFSATVAIVGGGDQPMMFLPPTREMDSLSVFWWPYQPGGARTDVQVAPVTAVSAVPGAGFRIRCRLEGAVSGSSAVQIRYGNMTPKVGEVEVATGELFSSPIVIR